MARNYDLPDYIDPNVLERTIVYLGLWPVIITFGIVGNILTLIVLYRDKETSTTSIYLKNLAAADLLTLSIKAVCVVFFWFQVCRPEVYLTWKVNSLSICSGSYFSEKISKYITIAVVFERIIAVTWPFRFKEICTPLRTTVAVILIYIVLLAVCLPVSIDMFVFFYNTEPIEDEYPMTVKEGTHYLRERLFKSELAFLFTKIYRAMNFIPIPIILIGNLVIIFELRKVNLVRSNSKSKEASQQGRKKERQITKLCLTISFALLILCSPFDMYFFLFFLKAIKLTQITQVVGDGFTTMATINSCANFVIYAVMNKKYRQGYLALFACCRRKAERRINSKHAKDFEGTSTIKYWRNV